LLELSVYLIEVVARCSWWNDIRNDDVGLLAGGRILLDFPLDCRDSRGSRFRCRATQYKNRSPMSWSLRDDPADLQFTCLIDRLIVRAKEVIAERIILSPTRRRHCNQRAADKLAILRLEGLRPAIVAVKIDAGTLPEIGPTPGLDHWTGTCEAETCNDQSYSPHTPDSLCAP
jgi:hypothetical protein